MDININKILKNKKPLIQKRFEYLKENYSVVNSIKYIDFARSLSSNELLENSKFITTEPTGRGVELLLEVLQNSDPDLDKLESQKSDLEDILNKAINRKLTLAEEHMDNIQECINYIDSQIELKKSLKYIKENTVYQLHLGYLPKPTLESTLTNDLDNIIQNINHHPEIAGQYELLVNQIRGWKAGLTAVNFVPVLTKNTALILGMTVAVTGSIVTLAISMPLLLVSKVISDRIDLSYINSYIRVIDTQIKRASDKTKTKNANRALLKKYIVSLMRAKSQLIKYKNQIETRTSKKIVIKNKSKKKMKHVKESLSIIQENKSISFTHNVALAPSKFLDKFLKSDMEIKTLKSMRKNYAANLAVLNRYSADIKSCKVSKKLHAKLIAMYGLHYEDTIKESIQSCEAGIKKVDSRLSQLIKTKKTKSVKEGISEMEPNIIYAEEDDLLEIDDNNDNDSKDDSYGLFLESLNDSYDLNLNMNYYDFEDDEIEDEPIYDEDDTDDFDTTNDYFTVTNECSEDADEDLDDDDCFDLDLDDDSDEDDSIDDLDNDDDLNIDDIPDLDLDDEDSDDDNADEFLLSNFDISEECSTDLAKLNFAISYVNFSLDETTKEEDILNPSDCINIDSTVSKGTLESFNKLLRITSKYNNILTEGSISDVAVKVANKGEEVARHATNGLRHVGDAGKHVGVAASKIPEQFDNLINNTFGAIKKMDHDERRKRIIEGGFKLKLFKIIRNGILVGVGWAISPALTALGFVSATALDVHADDKIRKEILHELESELQICNEKIEDARGDSDKEKKYQLIRLKNKIEDDITRIKYRLD